MPFVKKSVLEKKKKISEAQTLRHERNCVKKCSRKGEMVSVGRRVFELALLANTMWCDDCDTALSFRYLEEEKQYGLGSVFKVRCHMCLREYNIASSSTLADTTGAGRSLQAINCKAALGCLDSGVGHEQFNKILSTMNLPTVCRNTMKLAEERVGPHVVGAAKESCKKVLALEARLTEERLKRAAEESNPDEPEPMDISPESTPTLPVPRRAGASTSDTPRRPRERAGAADREPAPLTFKFDFGWDKRGNGYSYDSHSGRGSLIGNETGKIVAYEVVSSYCAMCARGHQPTDHICSKNYEGSSKGMEPHSAVKMCLRNPDFQSANVRVGKLIADRDSSTIAALRRESPYEIKKIIDINHNTKCVNNALYKIAKKFTFLKKQPINYLKRCVAYAIQQNKENVEAVKCAIMNIEHHSFGEHEACGDWCKAKNNPAYIYHHLPNKKPFNNPEFRLELRRILQSQADDAEQLAPAGSSQLNESFNHMVVTRAPKSRHYCGTANVFRVSAAVMCKNLGANHIEEIFKSAKLSPSCSNYRQKLEERRQYKAKYQNLMEVKKRRLHLKMKSDWQEASSAQKEGLSYVSGMSSTFERAAEAASMCSWVPPPTPLQEDCSIVYVDIETTGLEATCEIVQLAAKCGEATFSVHILPKGNFSKECTSVTGLRKAGGKLWLHNTEVPTVQASEAAEKFVQFLAQCSSQSILVGHNIKSFDAPRILRFLRQQGFAKDFCQLIYGMTDTLPILKQGNVRKLEVLAKTYLKGPQWEQTIKNAHDALSDCLLLEGLLSHFAVTSDQLKAKVYKVQDFMQRQVQLRKKKINLPTLTPLIKHGISNYMVEKMAENGVSMQELEREYNEHGRKGIEVCLGVQLDGKPRVTKNKKYLDLIVAFFENTAVVSS